MNMCMMNLQLLRVILVMHRLLDPIERKRLWKINF